MIGCANQAAPPGGPQDLRPPVVVRTEPESFATMTDPSGRVRFFFDERISERVQSGDLESAVLVSPLTSEVRVSHGRNSITVWLEGGFRPGLVYRVTLLPVVSDLFGNQTTEAFEVVFSTGGDEEPTGTLAGEVWDRITGQGVNGAVVQAVGSDSLVNLAVADRRGVFAFRYLPAGEFTVTGFQDTNRNRSLDDRESRGSVATPLAVGDTLVVEVPILVPDTTPAVAAGARALDSVTVVVDFDDYLDPGAPTDQIGATLSREVGAAPSIARLMHESTYAEYVDQVADSFARLDSIEAAAAAAAAPPTPPSDSTRDSLVVAPPAPDTAAPAARRAPRGPPAPAPQPRRPLPPRLSGAAAPQAGSGGRTRPGRRIVALLDGPLEPEVAYQLRITSVLNINGLPGGGGDVTLSYAPPPPPADSTAVSDSTAAPDSAALPDSVPPADSTDVRP